MLCEFGDRWLLLTYNEHIRVRLSEMPAAMDAERPKRVSTPRLTATTNVNDKAVGMTGVIEAIGTSGSHESLLYIFYPDRLIYLH